MDDDTNIPGTRKEPEGLSTVADDTAAGSQQPAGGVGEGVTQKAAWDQGAVDAQTGPVTDDYADIANPGTTTLDEIVAGTGGIGSVGQPDTAAGRTDLGDSSADLGASPDDPNKPAG